MIAAISTVQPGEYITSLAIVGMVTANRPEWASSQVGGRALWRVVSVQASPDGPERTIRLWATHPVDVT